ncbi:hypothetical protein GCM10011579_036610 [Streptomyces albiflavescens]|uniref:Uncharacterized protein n=1 Tax=Streptomyces albiflavescens TaxID=1623582 RepID=A0A918D544_9ACTN|nr:hypothetical protein GCM10011579_036610 [Streptomyces albiflavescens]
MSCGGPEEKSRDVTTPPTRLDDKLPAAPRAGMPNSTRARESPVRWTGRGFPVTRTAKAYSPPSDIPCTAGIVPSRPFWKSSKACWSSSRVFITKGP